MSVQLSQKKIVNLLLLMTLALAVVSLAGQFYIYLFSGKRFLGLVRLFDLDEEHNIPTVFSASLLLFCSLLLGLIAAGKQLDNRYGKYWSGLSLIFIFLAMDEMFMIHEKINATLNPIVGSAKGQYWDVFNCMFVVIFSSLYLKFLLHLPKRIQINFVLGFACFFIGAVGIELIGVKFCNDLYHQNSFLKEAITTMEECLELIGLAIFINGLLLYIGYFIKDIHINILAE